MAKRKFHATLIVEIEIDDQIFADVLTDEWRSNFYALETAEDVAGHLAYNLVQGRALQSLDGFADQPRERSPTDVSLEIDHVEECHEDELAELKRALSKIGGPGAIGRRAYNVLTGPHRGAQVKGLADLKSRPLQNLRDMRGLGEGSLRAMARAGLLADEVRDEVMADLLRDPPRRTNGKK